MMSQGFGAAFIVIWVICMIGGIIAGVFFILAAWKAMRAHESIAVSMKQIATTLQVQTRAAALAAEKAAVLAAENKNPI